MGKEKVLLLSVLVLCSFIIYFQSQFTAGVESILIEEPDDNMREIAEEITRRCALRSSYPSQNRCNYNKISEFVDKNISYNNSYHDYPTAWQVINRSEARCVGKTVIFNSLMKSLGYKTQYVWQPQHLCSAVYINGDMTFWGCHKDRIFFVQ